MNLFGNDTNPYCEGCRPYFPAPEATAPLVVKILKIKKLKSQNKVFRRVIFTKTKVIFMTLFYSFSQKLQRLINK